MSIQTSDANVSVEVSIGCAYASVACSVEDLSIGASWDKCACTLEYHIAGSASAGVDLTVPHKSIGAGDAGIAIPIRVIRAGATIGSYTPVLASRTSDASHSIPLGISSTDAAY